MNTFTLLLIILNLASYGNVTDTKHLLGSYSKTLDDFLDMEKKDFVDIIKTHHDVLFNVSCVI